MISRREALRRFTLVAAVVVGGSLGLSLRIRHKAATLPAPPPSELVSALRTEEQLLDAYTRTLAQHPGLSVLSSLQNDVSSHISALRAVLDRYPGWRLSPTTGPSDPAHTSPASTATAPTGTAPTGTARIAATTAALADAARHASASFGSTCLSWSPKEANAATVVPLLGSVSACLATHARVLL
jgi:hypothetical protein